MSTTVIRLHFVLATLLAAALAPAALAQPPVYHRTVDVNGVKIFYREAGPSNAPNVLLLHGFPTSSHMYRHLIPRLAERYHVVAPDYPGYGASDAPNREQFEYSFDNMAAVVDQLIDQLGLESYAIYLQDYGAPIGLRIASARPERVTALVVQNGNAYDEGLDNPFWEPIKAYWTAPTSDNREALRGLLSRDATIWQYTHGVRDASRISPDNWNIDQPLLDRPGNQEIQLDMFLSYGSNPPLYPKWQAYFREHQPPTLVAWGKNDQIFPGEGAHPYRRDLKNVEFHLLDTGHFALEEEGELIAELMLSFLIKHVSE